MKKNISRANLASPSRAHRLVFIDGNAILHRAYHALPPLTAPDGSVVNAVYGFVSILIKIFNDLRPTYMAVAFDRPEPTFRKKLYTDYQAKRPEMDSDLVSQIPKVQDVVRAFGIHIYDKAGFEADDVIGTIAKQAGMEVIIVTGDRDILQLVDDKKGVKVFMPTKGLSEGRLYGESEVVEKMGVSPKQITDLKALMGDASDNYPGVPGIGPKTAVGLINAYGSVKKLYDQGERGDWGDVGDTIKIKLLAGRESAFLSKDLATIRTNVPVEVGELAVIATLDTPEARKKLEEFHFPSLVKRLVGDKVIPKAEKPKRGKGEQQELF